MIVSKYGGQNSALRMLNTFKGFILPKQNAQEVAVVENLEVYGIEHIEELVKFLNDEKELQPEVFMHLHDEENEEELYWEHSNGKICVHFIF